MDSIKQTRLLQIVVLVVLAATLFNVVRSNSFAIGTTEFRRETRRQLAANREALAEQQRINAELRRAIEELRTMHSDRVAAPAATE